MLCDFPTLVVLVSSAPEQATGEVSLSLGYHSRSQGGAFGSDRNAEALHQLVGTTVLKHHPCKRSNRVANVWLIEKKCI